MPHPPASPRVLLSIEKLNGDHRLIFVAGRRERILIGTVMLVLFLDSSGGLVEKILTVAERIARLIP